MIYGLKTGEERRPFFVFGIPAAPSTHVSFRATTPFTESTAASVLGVGLSHLQLLLAVLWHLEPHLVHQQLVYFEGSHIDSHLPIYGLKFLSGWDLLN